MSKKNKPNPSPLPIFLLIGGGIALIAAAVLLMNQSNTPAPVAQEPIEEEIPYPEIARISLEEAKATHEAGTAIFLDVRSPEAFAASHIDGAINIYAPDLLARLNELDPKAWIIPYCT